MTLSATWIEYGSVNDVSRRDEVLGERRRDRHELERRAGLVDVRHGRVPLVLGRDVRETSSRRSRARSPSRAPRPCAGRARRRSPASRATGARQSAARPRPPPGSCGRSSGRRRARRAPGTESSTSTTRPSGSLITVSLAGAARQRAVALELHPGEAPVVDACEADQLRSDRPERVVAPLLRIEAEAREVTLPAAPRPSAGSASRST